jgi:hypothetical protein
MSEVVDLMDKIRQMRIEKNNARNERYLIRNELVNFISFITRYDLDKHELQGLKDFAVDHVLKLNIKIAEDLGLDEPKNPTNY